MNIINEMLAKLFDSFKAKNPQLATLIIFILGIVIYATENGLSEIIGYDMTTIVKWITFVLIALQGSRTTSILKNTDPPK